MDELKTEFRALALVRRANGAGAFATVARRGDPDAGALMVKVALPDRTARLYAPSRNMEGERIYVDMAGAGVGTAEAEIDAYLERRVRTDPDLWIVEIEDREGRHFLVENME